MSKTSRKFSLGARVIYKLSSSFSRRSSGRTQARDTASPRHNLRSEPRAQSQQEEVLY